MENSLSASECDALLELGQRGPGGDFDEGAMARLYALGLVEVRLADRRLVLTEGGRQLFIQLSVSPG
jgi:hypothetical protein